MSEPMKPTDFHCESRKEASCPLSAGLGSAGSRVWVAEACSLPHGAEKVQPGHEKRLSPGDFV